MVLIQPTQHPSNNPHLDSHVQDTTTSTLPPKTKKQPQTPNSPALPRPQTPPPRQTRTSPEPACWPRSGHPCRLPARALPLPLFQSQTLSQSQTQSQTQIQIQTQTQTTARNPPTPRSPPASTPAPSPSPVRAPRPSGGSRSRFPISEQGRRTGRRARRRGGGRWCL